MLNRGVIIVTPKQPFFDWLRSFEEDDMYDFEEDEKSVYLVEKRSDTSLQEKWLDTTCNGSHA